MSEEFQDDTKKTSKEIWLFLIFVDIVALCVFGYFVYKAFFNDFDFSSLMPQTAVQEDTIKEDITGEDVVVAEINIPQEEAPSVKAEAEKEPSAAQAEAKVKEEAPVAKPAKVEQKRQSVFVSGTGKTRKVTFKYYGDARKVSIVAGFTMRKPVSLKKSGGVWSTTLVLYPGDYRYMYIVDGVEMADPNAKLDDGRSVLLVK